MDNDRDRNLIEIPQASETQRLIVGRIALRFHSIVTYKGCF